jgi:hypothetical protein
LAEQRDSSDFVQMHSDPWLMRRAALHDMIRETHERALTALGKGLRGRSQRRPAGVSERAHDVSKLEPEALPGIHPVHLYLETL